MISQLIADYVLRERTSKLAPEVLHCAKRALVDWYAAAFAGSVLAPTPILLAALSDELDHGKSRLAWGPRATIRAAAFINGAASHAAEVDDVFREAVYHPGSPTISAALAIGHAYGGNGEQLLRAVVAAYEVSTRIGAAILDAHYKFWHSTGTVGSFAAAIAGAAMLKLSRAQTAHAIATATTLAAGLQQAFRSESMSKPLHAAHAAEVGVTSALGACHGLIGALDVIEGDAGFGAAMAGCPDWANVLDGLGSSYNIGRMTVKNHCCCGQTFAAIDAALAIRQEHRIVPEQIRGIGVTTYKTALDVAGNQRAEGPSEARFSLPYVVARAIVHGSVRLNAFNDSALRDPKVRELMTRTHLSTSVEFNDLFPAKRCARVDVELMDGRVLSAVQRTRKGDPELPLSDEELEDKYYELSEPVIGRTSARRLLDTLWSLDRQPALEFEI